MAQDAMWKLGLELAKTGGWPHEGLTHTESLDYGSLTKIRDVIKKLSPDFKIRVQCFNEEEIEWLKSRLTSGELRRIVEWTWIK